MEGVIEQRTAVSRSNFGGIWPSLWVLAITIVLIGPIMAIGYYTLNVAEASSEFLPRFRVPWFAESVIYYHMDYAKNSDEYNDVIFLGSSAVMAGLHTAAFQQQTGLSAYSFGTVINLGPDGQLEMFKTYLANHPAPRLLVYMAFPRDIGDEFIDDVVLRGRFSQVYGVDLETQTQDAPIGVQDYYTEGFWTIYGLVKGGAVHPYDAPRGGRPTHRETGPSLLQEKGWQQYPQARILNLQYLEELEAFTISDWYSKNLLQMAKYARSQGIGFMVYMMPVPKFSVVIDDSPVVSWAADFKSKFPEADVAGLPIEIYEHQLWGNGFHLNLAGADVFTQQVGQNVMDYLK
ncbi:MAG: hypothetical protein IIB31_08415 [Chloroflexi bacterium]|nr:hypothetical protein [Chloroflexota bacterium]